MKKLLITVGILFLLLSNKDTVNATSYETPIAGISVALSSIEPKYNWTTERVNLRSDSNLYSNIIKTLDKRTKVKVIRGYKEWTKVEYDSTVGYIYTEYLTDKESKFTSNKNIWGIDLTKNEVELLAKIMWLECRGENEKTRLATIGVVLNRVVSLEFPDDLYSVLSQKGEFSTWKNRSNANPEDREYEDIDKILNSRESIIDLDYLYFSTNRQNSKAIRIGNHWFSKAL